MLNQLKQSIDFLTQRIKTRPKVGIILGTGLGKLVDEIEITNSIDYTQIPNFPLSTVDFHAGKLIFGTLNGVEVVVMKGRFHYYEGYSLQEVTFPVRVLKGLGIDYLFVSNAAGGINKTLKKSDIMIINDHIDLLPSNALRGKYYPEMGPRFPDMSQPYNFKLIELAKTLAFQNGIEHKIGTYASVSGPNLETPAEYRYLQTIGADAVGMSTVPEVIVGVQCGLKIFAISCITDEAFPDKPEPVTIESVMAAAAVAEPKMTALIKLLVGTL